MNHEHSATGQSKKTGPELAQNPLRAARSKTDVRYWEDVIFQQKYMHDGELRLVSEWTARIRHLGAREKFSLGTANKSAAAGRAKEIYLHLVSSGWEATLAKFKPKSAPAKAVVTVGEFLEASKGGSASPKTIAGYSRAFRTIISGIFDIGKGKSKYDPRQGGREKWLQQVEARRLSDVTPKRVHEWKTAFLARAGSDPRKIRTAKNSANSLMRNAKSLFTTAALKFIALEVPKPLPFDGVDFEPRQSMRYRSSFKFEDLIAVARAELPEIQWAIFLLAGMAGLRRDEIDKLQWSAFKWGSGVIGIDRTEFFGAKTETSIGDVDVDPELMTVFQGFFKSAKAQKDDFVIPSKNKAKMSATYAHYRARKEFVALNKWLRAHDVTGIKPLHTLRKEYGSQVCAKHGVFAASHALRHADITITRQHYLDQKNRATLGMGHLLGAAMKPQAGDDSSSSPNS